MLVDIIYYVFGGIEGEAPPCRAGIDGRVVGGVAAVYAQGLEYALQLAGGVVDPGQQLVLRFGRAVAEKVV